MHNKVIYMAKRANMFEPFQKISGVKKIVKCKSCGKRMEVSNFNRALCEECGYRGDRKKVKADEDTEILAAAHA